MSACYVPGTVLETEKIKVNKTDKNSALLPSSTKIQINKETKKGKISSDCKNLSCYSSSTRSGLVLSWAITISLMLMFWETVYAQQDNTKT